MRSCRMTSRAGGSHRPGGVEPAWTVVDSTATRRPAGSSGWPTTGPVDSRASRTPADRPLRHPEDADDPSVARPPHQLREHAPDTVGRTGRRQRPDVHRISTDVHVTRTSAPAPGDHWLRSTALPGEFSLAGPAPVAIRSALPVAAASTAIAEAPSSGPAVRTRARRAGRPRASVRAAALSPAARRSGRGTDGSRHGTTALWSADSSWVIVSSRVHAAPSHHVCTPFEPFVCTATRA